MNHPIFDLRMNHRQENLEELVAEAYSELRISPDSFLHETELPSDRVL
jgi:hypothetical protein